MKTFATALAVVLACSLTGCSGGDDKKPGANTSAPPSSAPATAMVQGTLMEVGGPSNNRHPISGTVTFTRPGSVTKAQVDESGKFAIGLYPGDYEIRATSPLYQSGKAQCSPAKPTTTLTVDKTVTVNVYCQLR